MKKEVDSKREKLLWLWRRDIAYFLRMCFPHHFTKEFAPFHYELFKVLQEHPFVAIGAARGHGKALSLDSKILTPNGWTTIGKINVGDIIMGGDGKPARVTHLHPISEMDLYEIRTRDGRRAMCNERHEWLVQCPQNTRKKIINKELRDIYKNYKVERFNKSQNKYYEEYIYFIPTCEPIEFKEKKQDIDAYTLGAWLGDGSSYNNGFTTADPEIFDYIPYPKTKRNTKYAYGITGLGTQLSQHGLLKNKHIPTEYLFGSIEQREALLQGLLDTDGYVQEDGRRAEFTTIRETLKNDFIALVRSLGGTATEGEHWTKCNGGMHHSFRVTCRFPDKITPFRLKRKRNLWKGSYKTKSAITNIQFIGTGLARCITVERGTFITNDYLPTHNSECISFGFVIWNLLCNPNNHFTIIISNNYANACKYLVPIKLEIETNEMLRYVFGDLKSDKWSEDEAEFISRVDKDFKKKIIVGGNEFKIRGQKYLQYRPDLVAIDDAEDDELVRSDVRRENFENWLLKSLTPAMTHSANDKIVMVGTILHRDSQLSKIIMGEGRYRDWFSKKYNAITEDGKALWGEHISLEWLLGEREKDPYKFAQEYMNNPVPLEHAMFKDSYFDNYEDSELPKELVINITVDLACTDKSYSDYTVILPVGIDTFGDWWVLPYHRVKYADPDKIIEEIFDMYEKYKSRDGWTFGKLGIEKVAFQRFFIKNFDRERKKRGLHFPVVEIPAKGDKVQRIAQLQPLFASGDIHVKSSMLDLRTELLDFPRAQHDDVSDALAMHLELARARPHIKKTEDTHFKVTPEIQREKIMRRIRERVIPKVYTRFLSR